MDRKIIYPGQIPMVEDQLQAARFTQIGVGRLAGALYDESGTGASGFACTPGSGLSVTISPGQITQPGTIDATAFGVLPASASALPRQYILADPVNIAIPAAGATYIVYGTPGTTDTANAVLPYYNSANPAQTFAGTSNSGQTQPTVRTDAVTLGIAATVPSGSIPLWNIIVPSGATAITSAMISAASGAPLYPSLRRLAMRIVAPFNAALAYAFGGYPSKSVVADPTTTGAFWVSTADNNLTTPGASGASWVDFFAPVRPGRWLNTQIFTASGLYTPTPGTKQIILTLAGGGGSGGWALANNGSQVSVSSGGAAGSYIRAILTSGFSGGVQITIGAGGQATTSSGANGGVSSFGSLIYAFGGGFGGIGQITTSTVAGISPTGPSGATPIINSGTLLYRSPGSVGTGGRMFGTSLVVEPGYGGSSPWGCGGANSSVSTGGNGAGYAAGGGGTGSATNSSAQAGGNGSPGFAMIEEYS